MTTNIGLPDILCANSAEMSSPAGHYSHVCVANEMVYVSGQLPLDAAGVPLVNHSFGEQAKRVLANLDSCLRTAGVSRSRLVQVRIYMTDIAHWDVFNGIYSEWIGNHRPARAVAGVSQLHFGLSIEVEAVALSSGRVGAHGDAESAGFARMLNKRPDDVVT